MALKPIDRKFAGAHKFTYNGKEKDGNTQWYEYGQRDYASQLGRFFEVDRFAEKYYSMNPYQYGANNPVKFIDVNGDSIDISDVRGRYRRQLMRDLRAITGLKIQVKEGKLSYRKGKDGRAKRRQKKGVKVGSTTASDYLVDMIDLEATIDVNVRFIAPSSSLDQETNELILHSDGIQQTIAGVSSNLNNKTFGWGMTLFHELGHSLSGKGLLDNHSESHPTGDNVDFVNVIRSEMDEYNQFVGNNQLGYGQRMEYAGLNMPMNSSATTRDLHTWSTSKGDMFIRTTKLKRINISSKRKFIKSSGPYPTFYLKYKKVK